MKGALLTSFLLIVSDFALQAQGTAFIYQGNLSYSGSPANGLYDMKFTVYDSATAETNVIAGPLTNTAVPVTNGMFFTTMDFGSGVFNGNPRWLDIAIRTNGGTNFVVLSGRQNILATPYAITAANSMNLLGTVGTSNLPPSLAALSETNAASLTNLILASLQATNGGSGVLGLINGQVQWQNAPALNAANMSNIPVSQLTGTLGVNVTFSNQNAWLGQTFVSATFMPTNVYFGITNGQTNISVVGSNSTGVFVAYYAPSYPHLKRGDQFSPFWNGSPYVDQEWIVGLTNNGQNSDILVAYNLTGNNHSWTAPTNVYVSPAAAHFTDNNGNPGSSIGGDGTFTVWGNQGSLANSGQVVWGNDRYTFHSFVNNDGDGYGPYWTISGGMGGNVAPFYVYWNAPRRSLAILPNGTVTANNLSVTNLTVTGTMSGAVNMTNSGNVFTGNGGGLTNLNLSNAVGVLPASSIPTNIFASNIVVVPQAAANAMAKTPALGFNSWFGWGAAITESAIVGQIQNAEANGMLAAGYKYFCIDQGWSQIYQNNYSTSTTYSNGAVVWYYGTAYVSTVNSNLNNPPYPNSSEWSLASSSYFRTNGIPIISTNFPDGIAWLANFAHTNHALLGLYTPGPYTYAGGVGSFDYETQDGATYASWGIDYVKIDGFRQTVELLVPAMMRGARPVFCTATTSCDNTATCEFDPWVVGETSAHRGFLNNGLGPDMVPGNWTIFLQHALYVNKYNGFCGKGHWGDPDALDLEKSDHFTKCEMGVFCTLTTDILWDECPPAGGTWWQRLYYVTNSEAIAIDQDPGGYVGFIVSTNADTTADGFGWVIAKPLTGPGSGKSAVCLFNASTTSNETITVNWSDIGLPPGPALVRDVFQQANVGYYTNSYTVTLGPQDCQLLTITTNTTPFFQAGTNYLSDLGYLFGWTNVGIAGWPLDGNGYLTMPARDANISGGPLKLAGNTYTKGLGVAFTSHLQYALGGLASRFHSDVGIDQTFTSGPSAANFIVSVDGVQLWQSGTMTPNQIATCDISVAGGKVLTLDCISAESGGGEINFSADWANACITYDPSFAALQNNDGSGLTNLNAGALQGIISTNNLPTALANLASGFVRLQNSTNGPTPAQIGKNGAVLWVSNGIVYCSISMDGSTISSVKQIAP